MMVEIEGRSTTAIIKRLRGFAEIEQLHTTNGAWDLVAEIRAGSMAEFDRVLREIRQIEGILNSETSILLSSV
jgi:DNA-binding Lrp family transcriptional regulator